MLSPTLPLKTRISGIKSPTGRTPIHCSSFSVVPVSDVAVLMETPIMVDKVGLDQGALVGPAGG